ncbi:hypothetical protein [Thermococcus peptonophilus]
MEQRGSVVVYFDGLEYLTLYNDFPLSGQVSLRSQGHGND